MERNARLSTASSIQRRDRMSQFLLLFISLYLATSAWAGSKHPSHMSDEQAYAADRVAAMAAAQKAYHRACDAVNANERLVDEIENRLEATGLTDAQESQLNSLLAERKARLAEARSAADRALQASRDSSNLTAPAEIRSDAGLAKARAILEEFENTGRVDTSVSACYEIEAPDCRYPDDEGSYNPRCTSRCRKGQVMVCQSWVCPDK